MSKFSFRSRVRDLFRAPMTRTPAHRLNRLSMETLEDRTTPATITVTTLNDVVAVDGVVSLREAIQSVNVGANVNADVVAVGAYGTDDTILFDSSLVGGTSTLGSSMDTIIKAVQITGPTTGTITIDGDNLYRIFAVNATGEDVGISGLTLTKGKAVSGAALELTAGKVTVDTVTFTNNLATGGVATDDGGAIMVRAGELTVNNSTFTGNMAIAGGLGSGGAIAVVAGDKLTITGSTFTGNTAEDLGGAIASNSGTMTIDSSKFINNKNTNTFIGIGGAIAAYTFGNSPDALSITNSEFTGNTTTNNGGAIAVDTGTLTVSGSKFSDNEATSVAGVGGAISVYNAGGDTSITDSTFTGNIAEINGGALSFNANAVLTLSGSKFTDGNKVNVAAGQGGAVYISTNKASTISDVTISGNEASGATGQGGGIYVNLNTELAISNSTIDSNMADTGAGVFVAAGTKVTVTGSTISKNEAVTDGGGIYSSLGDVTITNSTISGNKADTGAGVYLVDNAASKLTLQNSTVAFNEATTKGGGVEVPTNALFTTVSSIIAKNTGTTGPDVDGKATSQGNNLFGNSGGLTLMGGTGDIVGVDPKLAPLADNGGPTFTHALMADSPALNGGSNTTMLTTDQRGTGFPREAGGAADIGAFEIQQVDTQTVLTVDAPEVAFGDPVTFTATVTIPGTTIPAVGSVTFTDADGNVLGTVDLVDGVATLIVSDFVPGTVSVTAAFTPAMGDTFFQPSQSAAVDVKVTSPFAQGSSFGAGAGGGTAFLQDSTGKTLQNVAPFGDDFRGGVRVATGDFNGDGTPDLVVGNGPGIASKVMIIDGKTGATLFEVAPFEASFTGGVYVAAGDINNDGVPELVITPDQGGGPRVQVYDGASFDKIADFFGITDPDFRGGARAAVADIDGDGFGDLIVSAGFEGGPRVAVWNGTTIATGSTPTKLIDDIFVFEDTLRNGAFVTGADIDGDGKADLIAGAGPGGGPRVVAFNGADLVAGMQTQMASFFAGNADNRNGVPVAVTDADGDGLPDLLTGTGEPITPETAGPSTASIYKVSDLSMDAPPVLETVDLFPGFTGGVFVG